MRLLPLLTLPLLVACEGPRERRIDPPKPNPITVQNTSSLRTQLDAEDVQITGITVDPNDGTRYVLDASRGLFELTEEGAVMIAHLEQLQTWDRPLASALTDVASLGDGKFAMTAANDGFLFDLNEGTFEQHFCYVPGEIIDDYAPTPIQQLTRSLTYDPKSNRMYAQPQTFANDTTGEVLRSQIGTFELTGGEGFGWIELADLDFLAGGLIILEDGSALLGRGSQLHPFSMGEARFDEPLELSSYGVTAIDAMAYDWQNKTILVVDALTDELVEITLN